MLILLKECHHLSGSRLSESDCSEELGNLLPSVAKLTAKGEDHAREVLNVGALGGWPGKFAGVHGRDPDNLKT